MKKTALLIALFIALVFQTISYEEKLFLLQLHIGGDHGELEKADRFTKITEEALEFYKEQNAIEVGELNERIEFYAWATIQASERHEDYQSMVRSFLALPQNRAELDWYILNDDFEHYRGDVFAAYLRNRVTGMPPYEDDRCMGKFYSTGAGGLDQAVGRLIGENNPENDERLQQIYDIVFEGR